MSVTIGIMQSYLFPYMGYMELIASVDKFVLYDDAKYIKGGWMNRNYYPKPFTFRLKKHADSAKINECFFFDVEEDKVKFSRKTGIVSPHVALLTQKDNLAINCERTLKSLCSTFGIHTPFYRSSEIPHGTSVQGVLDMVRALEGDTYLNLPGGKSLYHQDQFGDITLKFLETTPGPSALCYAEGL